MSVKASEDQREFFIPDICAPQPTLLMILLMELLVLVYVLAGSALPGFDLERFAITSLFVQWVLLSSAWLLCRFRKSFSNVSLPLATLASLSLVALVTLINSLFVRVYLADLIGIHADHWWITRNVIIALVLAIILLRYLYLQQEVRLREQWELQARLNSLRARIRPHFLFNTLNSIASLIGSRPDAAEQAVVNLAELFRNSLKESREQTTVQDEVRLTELYLGIEKLRLGDRLTVNWSIDSEISSLPMPSLIIQPLAENAVYHGIARLPSGGDIQISITRNDDDIKVSISNPIPTERTDSHGNHMALANIEQRLHSIYGTSASVHAVQSGERFEVTLQYPID